MKERNARAKARCFRSESSTNIFIALLLGCNGFFSFIPYILDDFLFEEKNILDLWYNCCHTENAVLKKFDKAFADCVSFTCFFVCTLIDNKN